MCMSDNVRTFYTWLQPSITEITEDEEHCQHCGGSYSNDSETRQQEWVECDNCWFHYECVGLGEMPEEEEEWKCPECL